MSGSLAVLALPMLTPITFPVPELSLWTLPGFRHVIWPSLHCCPNGPQAQNLAPSFSSCNSFDDSTYWGFLGKGTGLCRSRCWQMSLLPLIQISIPLFFVMLKHNAAFLRCMCLSRGVWCHCHFHFSIFICVFCEFGCSLRKHMFCVLHVPENPSSLTLNFP